MQKALTILVLFVFTSATTEFGQFLKLPLLIQHFYQHQQRSGQSLGSFLAEHYARDHEDADKNTDQQLPFKSIMNATPGAVVLSNQAITIDNLLPQAVQLHQPVNTSFIPSTRINNIFHPPRTV